MTGEQLDAFFKRMDRKLIERYDRAVRDTRLEFGTTPCTIKYEADKDDSPGFYDLFSNDAARVELFALDAADRVVDLVTGHTFDDVYEYRRSKMHVVR